MEKKEQVYQHICTDTITKLKEEQFESLGLDTLTDSLDLKMNVPTYLDFLISFIMKED